MHKKQPALYRYNKETCAYEPIGRSYVSIISYAVVLILTSSLIFATLVYAHSRLVETSEEVSLRKENAALARYETIVAKELSDVDKTLSELAKKDAILYQKFFTTPETPVEHTTPSYNKILTANVGDFRSSFTTINRKLDKYLAKSLTSNQEINSWSELNYQLSVLAAMPVTPPVEDFEPKMVLSGFGKRIHPFHKALYDHPGIDIAVPRGTSVTAPAGGTVITVRKSTLEAGYGNYIEIQHDANLVTRYAHLDELLVRVGQNVLKGQVIALSGSSGGSIAPHIHYEIIRNGLQVDPAPYLMQELTPASQQLLFKLTHLQNQALD